MSFVDIRARLLKCSTLSLNSEEIWKLRLHRKRLRHTFLSCDWAVVLPFDSIHPSILVVQRLMLYSFSSASINSCFPLLYRCNSSDCTSGSELIKNTGDSAQYCSQSPSLLTQSTRDFSANVVHALCCNLVLSKFCAFVQITHHSLFSNWKGLPCICLKNSFCGNSPENAWQVLLQHQLSQDTH